MGEISDGVNDGICPSFDILNIQYQNGTAVDSSLFSTGQNSDGSLYLTLNKTPVDFKNLGLHPLRFTVGYDDHRIDNVAYADLNMDIHCGTF